MWSGIRARPHGAVRVIGRGGLIRPVTAGVYEVNSRMRYDLRNAQMKHACNLGGLLAASWSMTFAKRDTSSVEWRRVSSNKGRSSS